MTVEIGGTAGIDRTQFKAARDPRQPLIFSCFQSAAEVNAGATQALGAREFCGSGYRTVQNRWALVATGPVKQLKLLVTNSSAQTFNQRVVGSIPTGLTIQGRIGGPTEGQELFSRLASHETGYPVYRRGACGAQARGLWWAGEGPVRLGFNSPIFTQRPNLTFEARSYVRAIDLDCRLDFNFFHKTLFGPIRRHEPRRIKRLLALFN